MALVTAKYGENVKATVTIANAGAAPGRFRLSGVIYDQQGQQAGNFWDKKVVGDPTQAAQLVQQAGAKNVIEIQLAGGQQATVNMWTAPLWKPPNVATALYKVVWTLTCVETGQSVTRTDADAIAVTGQAAGSIVNVTYAVA